MTQRLKRLFMLSPKGTLMSILNTILILPQYSIFKVHFNFTDLLNILERFRVLVREPNNQRFHPGYIFTL
ncbi:Uncharacterised protein [[Eubacterium] contortum]|uniref:Uncharacterized protein n=1 Tax=Faecalicatena contorta TaxID=39482 RepID=A0A174CGE5_9FIRM|nr:Uncharacterised protein [[Eubacterium] contortum] [Faecalicatena contorta]